MHLINGILYELFQTKFSILTGLATYWWAKYGIILVSKECSAGNAVLVPSKHTMLGIGTTLISFEFSCGEKLYLLFINNDKIISATARKIYNNNLLMRYLNTCGYLDTTDMHFVKAYWKTIPPHLPMEVRTVATGVAFGRPIAKTIGQIRSRFYSTNDVPLLYKMVVCQILRYLGIEIKKR